MSHRELVQRDAQRAARMADEPAAKRQALESEVEALRGAERRMQRDLGQHRRRESSMVLRLALKERENADLQQSIRELRQALHPSHAQVTTLLLDPAVNAEIVRLREEVKDAKGKEKEAQDQLQATGFDSGSIMGKKLIQKCKELQAENDQLGKDLSAGRVQKLHADAALQKEYAVELKKALTETRGWVEHMSEELDTSQALVLSLRRELNALKAKHAEA
jgi:hypothetical protein